MRRDLAKEVRKTAAREFVGSFPSAIAIYSGTIGGETESPPEYYYEETVSAPAINAVRNLSFSPLVANTLLLRRTSDDFEYTAGVDFTENATLGRFTNLTITSGQSLRAGYWYRSAGGGSAMSGAAILAALLPVDGPGSLLDSDMVDGQHAAAFAAAAHNHDLVYVKLTDVGVTIASLVGGKVPTSQLPALAINDIFTVASQAAMLALTAERGDMAIRSDTSRVYVLSAEPASTLANWVILPVPAGAVTSVNGQTGVINLSAHDVGAYLQSETYTKTQVDAAIANAGGDFGFEYATLVKYGL